eukprot:m.13028 g.13028  ORF g.13028 m.13028 type:complete len:405 (+) comp10019_c0_seq2:121-1335(+)
MFVGGGDDQSFDGDPDVMGGGTMWTDSLQIHRVDSSEIMYRPAQKPPKTVGPYILGKRIGEGSFGRVKEAIHMKTLQRVAVKIMKIMKLRKLNNGNGPANAKKEITLLRSIRHPNVVRLYDVYFGVEKEKIYMVLEYCAGNLKEMLDKAPAGKFPLHQAHNYYTQLMHGLMHIHSQGVVHRDIKPGNLLLSNGDVLKISDFGVADVLDRYNAEALCGSGAGTRPFMAPELVDGLDSFDGVKVDIWASGVTLWNFVTGDYPFPFEHGSLIELYSCISKGEYTIPDDLPVELASLLRGVLTVNADLRLSIPDIMQQTWMRVPPEVSPDTLATTVPLPPRDDGQQDYDRGTTLVPFLDMMHSIDTLRTAHEYPDSPFGLYNAAASGSSGGGGGGFKKFISSLFSSSS